MIVVADTTTTPALAMPSDTVAAKPKAANIVAAKPSPANSIVAANAVAADTIAADTVAANTVVTHKAIMLTYPHPNRPPEPALQTFGFSGVVLLLILVFTAVCLRFRNNVKYVKAIVDDLVEVRLRHNIFDDTVRETSFLVMLNALWSLSAGIIVYAAIPVLSPFWREAGFSLEMTAAPAVYMLCCMGITLAYSMLMACAYSLVGNVFTDSFHAVMWVKGFAASQGLLSLIFFPLALLCLCYPEYGAQLLWVALGSFAIAKIIFIWKGFRIFFTQISSWVLFLYYLCSLEIVPLVITFVAALQICAFVGS